MTQPPEPPLVVAVVPPVVGGEVGLRATVDGNVFYRVQIGPIDELEALNRTRRQLADAGIEALPLKLRE